MLAGPLVWGGLLAAGVPRQSGVPSATLLLMTVLVAPVLEEIVFRGGLQTFLKEKPVFSKNLGGGISLANVLTSLVFAGFHVFRQPVAWAASIFLPSLVFGWALDRTRSVIPSMLLHAWYNLGFVWLFVR